jgi:flagellar motor switch protein FliG
MALSGYEKAAIFLRGIGEETAAEIMKSLDMKDISKLSTHMSKLAIGKEDLDRVFREAVERISTGELRTGGSEYIKRILGRVLGEDRANRLIDTMDKDTPIDSIRDIDPKTLANFLVTEHPQTIALALCLLEPTQAADVIKHLPDESKTDIAVRIASTESIPADAVQEIEEALKVLDVKKGMGTKFGGIKMVAEILNQSDRAVEQMILEKVEEDDSELAESIRQFMFIFEDIASIDDRGIQMVLKEVSTEELVVALKTASEALKQKIFRNMSQRAAQILREEMEIKGPVRVSEVEAAQQSIVKVARKLADEGKVVLAGKGGEEFVV